MTAFLQRHSTLLRRGFVFALGGLVSFALNLIPYKILTRVCGWSHDPAYALSLTWVTLLMFFWNYRVNFPTRQHWRECALRYSLVVVAMWAVNFSLVRLGKSWLPVSGAIFLVGFLVAALKFGIYHWWVFPHHNESPIA